MAGKVRVKICGITTAEDASVAVSCGADALGFVFFSGSPRAVSEEVAAAIIATLPPFVTTVGVFVDEKAERVNEVARRCGLDVVQLHGSESPEYCALMERRTVKAFRIRDWQDLDPVVNYRVSAILLDTYVAGEFGGTGQTFNWDIARELAKTHPVILSGGLSPENVRDAVRTARPYAVDVSSGVERAGDKRRKDPERVRAFIESARSPETEIIK